MEQGASLSAAKVKESMNQSCTETKENLEKEENKLKAIEDKRENVHISEAEKEEFKFMVGKIGGKNEETQRNLEEEI